jgi:hypothetical protein
MTAVTYGTSAPAATVTAKVAPKSKVAPQRPGLFRLLFEAFIEARQLQAEMALQRHIGFAAGKGSVVSYESYE